MPLFYSPDRRVLFALETPGEGDGNSVVYYDGVPVWDRFTYEATHDTSAPAPPTPHPVDPGVVPPLPPPAPPVVGGPVRLLRVTDASDGPLLNRGYAYWPTAVVLEDRALTFVGHADGQPRFFMVNLTTGAVQRLGPLLGYQGTSEGWYFDEGGWVYLVDGPRLRRVHPLTGGDRVVLDISETHRDCRLWQAHSSEDGQTHSATVERITNEGPYQRLGTVVVRRGTTHFFGAQGVLDESQVDCSGRFLVIKEDHDNRILDLDTGRETLITNAAGALGHSDMGDGVMVGEDDQIGGCVAINLHNTAERRLLFSTWGMGVVSVRGGRCLVTDATHISLVALDGSGVTPLLAHGMTGGGYDQTCRATLSPDGRVASFISNQAGRLDLYVMTLP